MTIFTLSKGSVDDEVVEIPSIIRSTRDFYENFLPQVLTLGRIESLLASNFTTSYT